MRWFQSVNGLAVTGKADSATQQLLYSSQAKAASGYSPDSYDTLSRSNRYNANVVPLQRRLKALGYLSGSVDGYFGSNTYRAVRSFQSRNGLAVTGVADPARSSSSIRLPRVRRPARPLRRRAAPVIVCCIGDARATR